MRVLLGFLGLLALSGCATNSSDLRERAHLTPKSPVVKDLKRLPEPKGKIAVAVYSLRDQTGQYKPSPDSSFSTAVTQGGASLLLKALLESNWFIPVERESLQNLLTERKIIRALETPQEKSDAKAPPTQQTQIPPLMPANVLIEGGVVAYESNVRTGGTGARYLGVGISTQYRVDHVTVNLRLVDVRSGQVLNSVSTTKTIYSQLLDSGIFKYVSFKKLLEVELGYSQNEPAQLCVNEAIEAAVMHLIVQGLEKNRWQLKNPGDMNHPIIQTYLNEERLALESMDAESPSMSNGQDRTFGTN